MEPKVVYTGELSVRTKMSSGHLTDQELRLLLFQCYSDVDDLNIDDGTDANGNIALSFFEFTVLQPSAAQFVWV